MTVLALRMSSRHNGVSRIHGDVSRRMWSFVYPGLAAADVPISHITNGVHTATWLAPAMAQLYNDYLGRDWYNALDDSRTWASVVDIPDQLLWKTRLELKQKLVAFVTRARRRSDAPPGRVRRPHQRSIRSA